MKHSHPFLQFSYFSSKALGILHNGTMNPLCELAREFALIFGS